MSRRGNGEGSIFQRQSDGRYVGAYLGADGHRHALYKRTRIEVRDRLAIAMREAKQGIPAASVRLTVATYLEDWLRSTETTIRPATFLSYRAIVRGHFIPALGQTALARLTPQQVDAMLRAKTASGLSPRRVAYIRTVLRRALGQALRWGVLGRNVATLVDPPKAVGHEIKPLSPTECQTLLAQVRGDRLEAMYVVALATGLRQGELFGIRWSDLDLTTGTLTVRRALAKTVDGYGFRRAQVGSQPPRSRTPSPGYGGPPGALGPPAPGTARPRLGMAGRRSRILLHDRDAARLAECDPGLQRHLADGGIPRRRFHDLRHSAATLLLAQGVSPRVVQEILGHSSVTLPLGTYSHVLPALKKDAADRMDAILTGS